MYGERERQNYARSGKERRGKLREICTVFPPSGTRTVVDVGPEDGTYSPSIFEPPRKGRVKL